MLPERMGLPPDTLYACKLDVLLFAEAAAEPRSTAECTLLSGLLCAVVDGDLYFRAFVGVKSGK